MVCIQEPLSIWSYLTRQSRYWGRRSDPCFHQSTRLWWARRQCREPTGSWWRCGQVSQDNAALGAETHTHTHRFIKTDCTIMFPGAKRHEDCNICTHRAGLCMAALNFMNLREWRRHMWMCVCDTSRRYGRNANARYLGCVWTICCQCYGQSAHPAFTRWMKSSVWELMKRAW